jgi:hypothetical protein
MKDGALRQSYCERCGAEQISDLKTRFAEKDGLEDEY